MKKIDVVRLVLNDLWQKEPKNDFAKTYAPSNIALCKYWGKRDQELNLPMTSSLSVSLGNRGATTELTVTDLSQDSISVNGRQIDLFSAFGKRLLEFIDLFRANSKPHFDIKIQSTIPIAAGMASSAAGFASVVQALNHLYGWQLSDDKLSILARLGSGSACRSLWQGFVEWYAGIRDDGMDSYGHTIGNVWPELCLGLLIMNDQQKEISSREAMLRTVTTSPLYAAWPAKVNTDLTFIKQAISIQDFNLLGQTAESNAMNMHATMMSAWPPIVYSLPETISAMKKVWQLRHDGLPIYFTQDAGPNLKLLFLCKDSHMVSANFPKVQILQLFNPND